MARPMKVTDRNKRHNRRRSISREQTLGRRNLREYFLIVTNGSETETRYFDIIARKMPRNAIRQIKIDFQNCDPQGIVDYALEKAEQDHYQHVATVFDKDDFVHFNNAISKMKAAEKRKPECNKKIEFYTAYSNECFELWMLLHFQEICAPLGRNSLFSKLQSHVEHVQCQQSRYSKTNFPFELLVQAGNQQEAVCRAKRMLEEAKKRNPSQPWTINPTTEVHVLVEKLNEFVVERE